MFWTSEIINIFIVLYYYPENVLVLNLEFVDSIIIMDEIMRILMSDMIPIS